MLHKLALKTWAYNWAYSSDREDPVFIHPAHSAQHEAVQCFL